MRIDIFYSKDNADHLKAASIVREAVRNLGISAIITEREAPTRTPKVLVDGFDLLGSLRRVANGEMPNLSYDLIAQALERTAWTSV